MSAQFQFRHFAGIIVESCYLLLFILQAPLYPLLRLLPFRPVQGQRNRPVIIAPDFLVSPPFYAKLRRELIRKKFTVLYFRGGSILQGAKEVSLNLASFLERYNVRHGILIAHGTSAPMALSLPDRARRRIDHLVSLGTAFNGSERFRRFGWIPYLHDFLPGCEFIRNYRIHTMIFDHFSPFSAWRNEWIRPGKYARYGEGRDLIFDEPGHYNLIQSEAIVKIIVDHLVERNPLNKKDVEPAEPEKIGTTPERPAS
jgi:hypothetical protein